MHLLIHGAVPSQLMSFLEDGAFGLTSGATPG
jgi:hypothetical protein